MKKSHVDCFLESCSDAEIITVLGYIKALKEDQLEAKIAETRAGNRLQ